MLDPLELPPSLDHLRDSPEDRAWLDDLPQLKTSAGSGGLCDSTVRSPG
jgi:hypothetical protein